jgi:hypothetical protein
MLPFKIQFRMHPAREKAAQKQAKAPDQNGRAAFPLAAIARGARPFLLAASIGLGPKVSHKLV